MIRVLSSEPAIMRPLSKNLLTASGALKRKFRPAIYFEASVLIDYWSAEGLERQLDTPKEIPLGQEYDEAVRNLFRYHDRLRKMALIRQHVCSGDGKLTVVTSPLAILELFEWHAYSKFKQIAANSAGIVTVERMSKKDAGDHLARIWKEGNEEARMPDSYIVNKAPRAALLGDCLLNTSFKAFHGLDGIFEVDLEHFAIDERIVGKLAALAFHQVGLADLLQIAAAKHLGCAFIASFDSDFTRCKDLIASEFGLQLVADRDNLLSLIRKGTAPAGGGVGRRN
jgi:hypothetical protein